jgi:endonuclease/exonuclease/phosphatase family metal-dependent hydrolase
VTRVRVLTFNLLARHLADGARRGELVRAGIRDLDADLVAFQEVVRTPGYDQARDLLGEGFTIARHPRYAPDGVGACLASRWPLGEVRTADLHVTPRAAGMSWSGAVAAEVLAPPPLGPLLLVHHKPNWEFGLEFERERQAVVTAGLVEDTLAGREMPVVLLGDLDAAPDAASIRFLTGRQSLDGASVCYQDAWQAVHPGEPGHTFSPGNRLVRNGDMPLERGRRIDYVMVRCGRHGPALEVVACERAFDREVDGVWASDHFAVVADLAVPARPVGSVRGLLG